MTIDADGNLWVAQFGGSRVGCYSPESGRKIDEVRLPVTNVTSCAFGGLELKTLYITTARIALDDDELKQQPQAGGLFRAAVGVSGVAAMTFAG
jgi:sugar lactone lactonase YvrE